MWPRGNWCPDKYRPLVISEGILAPMQSLTQLWAREGRLLADLWKEGDEPGLLVQTIIERQKGPRKLSGPSASEALRRATTMIISSQSRRSRLPFRDTQQNESERQSEGARTEIQHSVDDGSNYHQPSLSPIELEMSKGPESMGMRTSSSNSTFNTRKRSPYDTVSRVTKHVRRDNTSTSTPSSVDIGIAWAISIPRSIQELRRDTSLCDTTLAHCIALLARSDNWKCFEPGFPTLWRSRGPAESSGRAWPRHLVFILHHLDHWTVAHLDRKKLTLDTYNSLPSVAMNLKGLEDWAVRELSKQVWEGLAHSRKRCPVQQDHVNCGMYALVVTACLFQRKQIPDSIDSRRYRDFFANHLASATRNGTLKIRQLEDSTDRPTLLKKHVVSSLGTDRETFSPKHTSFTFQCKTDSGGPTVWPTQEYSWYSSAEASDQSGNPATQGISIPEIKHDPSTPTNPRSLLFANRTDDLLETPLRRDYSMTYSGRLRDWVSRMPSPDNIENNVRRHIKAKTESLIEELDNHDLRDTQTPVSRRQ
ncbi:hypothetical protein G7046_g9752 [Stylonectria norvegica]|nr:hypothetical protein G7046_g9752 [Stylonectria norvegica]